MKKINKPFTNFSYIFSILNSPFSTRKGFTLIELLVSISIIAILTALLTVNFVGARQRGRDGQRKANLYNIQSALELYRADTGLYPIVNQTVTEFQPCGNSLAKNGTVYMQKIPCDPSDGTSYEYTSTDGVSYSISACLENDQDSDKDDVTNPSCTTSSFTLTNP